MSIWTTRRDWNCKGIFTGWSALAGLIVLALVCGSAGNAMAFVNVLDFGAKSSNSFDSGPAIQAAINSATTNGDTVYLPAGIYRIGQPLVVSHGRGVRLLGDGEYATAVQSSWSATQPLLQFVDGVDNKVENLSLWGQAKNPASAGIECDSDGNGPASHLTVRNVNIGSPASTNVIDGIKFVDTTGANNANDQGFFDNVTIANFGHAAYSFTHPSSAFHTIIGGVVEGGPIGVYSQGGAFKIVGTTFTIDDVNFDLENSSNTASRGYPNPVAIADIASEGNSALLRTGTDPMMVTMTGVDEKGSAFNIPIINFTSAGSLTVSNSFFFYLGNNVNLAFNGGPSQMVNLTNNFIDLGNVSVSGGNVISQGNCFSHPVVLQQSGTPRITSSDQCNPLLG
ncbi:MAG TPA: glycosyl hydrolase family 28-related protein [Candidatus Binataceae bacterium]|nr:glycosyl hydrolase family 28-related protein [Candidatus Binataceae bacterium]